MEKHDENQRGIYSGRDAGESAANRERRLVVCLYNIVNKWLVSPILLCDFFFFQENKSYCCTICIDPLSIRASWVSRLEQSQCLGRHRVMGVIKSGFSLSQGGYWNRSVTETGVSTRQGGLWPTVIHGWLIRCCVSIPPPTTNTTSPLQKHFQKW